MPVRKTSWQEEFVRHNKPKPFHQTQAEQLKSRAYALKTEEGLEIGVVPRGVELFAFDAGLAAGVAAQLVEGQPT